MIQSMCIPVVCSFLQGNHKFDELPISVQNLIGQCARDIGDNISNMPKIDPATGLVKQGKPCTNCP